MQDTPILLGTSITPAGWEGSSYLMGLKPADSLTYYAQQFHTVDVESTYFRVSALSITMALLFQLASSLIRNGLHLTSRSGRIFARRVMFQSGQPVRVNLAGLQAEGVMFQAAVTDAVGHIVKQTSEQPPIYRVKLLFSFRGVTEVEVPADRIHADR